MNYDNLKIPNIRLFVFGTLRVGEELDYYMEGSSPWVSIIHAGN